MPKCPKSNEDLDVPVKRITMKTAILFICSYKEGSQSKGHLGGALDFAWLKEHRTEKESKPTGSSDGSPQG